MVARLFVSGYSHMRGLFPVTIARKCGVGTAGTAGTATQRRFSQCQWKVYAGPRIGMFAGHGRRCSSTNGFKAAATAVGAGLASAGWWIQCTSACAETQADLSKEPSAALVASSRTWVEKFNSTGSTSGSEEWVGRIRSGGGRLPLLGKRLMLVAGGQGDKSVAAVTKNCDTIIKPMLQALGATVDSVLKTDEKDKQSRARDLTETGDLSELDAIIVVGGEKTLKDVRTIARLCETLPSLNMQPIVGGLAAQSDRYNLDSTLHTRNNIDPLKIPVGFVATGKHGERPGNDEDIRSVLRIADWAPSSVPFIQCQTDNGTITPMVSSGVRLASDEWIAYCQNRWAWIGLPNITRKLFEIWAIFRLHKYDYKLYYLPDKAPDSASPTFDQWPSFEEAQADQNWEHCTGKFVTVAVKPLTNCEPADSAAAELCWGYDEKGEFTRAYVEKILRAGAPQPESRRIRAFAIESAEAPPKWQRRCSIDGEACDLTISGRFSIRGRLHDKGYIRL